MANKARTVVLVVTTMLLLVLAMLLLLMMFSPTTTVFSPTGLLATFSSSSSSATDESADEFKPEKNNTSRTTSSSTSTTSTPSSSIKTTTKTSTPTSSTKGTTPSTLSTPTTVMTTSTETTTKPLECPQGWMHYEAHCYKAFAHGKNLEDAGEACNLVEAKLASIHSRKENIFIRKLLDTTVDPGRTGRFLIGLRLVRKSSAVSSRSWDSSSVEDHRILNRAYWTDGSAMDFGNPLELAPGSHPWGNYKGNAPEPNNHLGRESCVVFGHDDNSEEHTPISVGWIDDLCSEARKSGYICKKKHEAMMTEH